MRQRIFEEIADKIEATITIDSSSMLPSISDLSRTYEVSYQTIWKALSLLVEKKKIVSRRGKRFRVSPELFPERAVTDEGSSASRLQAIIQEAVLSGTYPAGQPLPKVNFFALSEHVSSITVQTAMQRLSAVGTIHKKGKRWIAGAAKKPQHGAYDHDAPIILLILRHEGEWKEYFESFFLRPFVNSFNGELLKSHAEMHIALREAHTSSPLIRAGLSEVRSIIHESRSRYRGAIFFDTTPNEQDMSEWVQECSLFGRAPVVFFDSVNLGDAYNRNELKLPKSYYRLHLDETASVRAALTELDRAGHTILGIPEFPFNEQRPWMQQRKEIICAVAKAEFPQFTIECVNLQEKFWFEQDVTRGLTYSKFIDQLKSLAVIDKKDGRATSGPSKALIAHTPSLVALLKRNVTAILALNDNFAFKLYLWCTYAGIEIPRHLSLISFDNLPDTMVYPVSSIDFGFDRLGHIAAHILLGDIPVVAGKTGAISCIPIVNNRRSIAAPSRRHDIIL